MSIRAIAFIAFLFIGAGVLAGVMPLTEGGLECGSAFISPSNSAGQDHVNECEDVRNLVQIPTTILLAVGGVLLLAAFFLDVRLTVERHRREEQQSAAPGIRDEDIGQPSGD
ncbi:hypothetical protein ACFPOI_20290 [Nonomuraea angiospora]|uniref:Uncharacterized protein n=1 Tax=Nonomuraea angiospora TaxID=46172 RepID=A0ABR9MJA7_9ACTN|nr:hypothetical protein [Nonomuraea angiospora]MBE1592998.1 hypothetical protein [Nonomuraea angiospora]